MNATIHYLLGFALGMVIVFLALELYLRWKHRNDGGWDNRPRDVFPMVPTRPAGLRQEPLVREQAQ